MQPKKQLSSELNTKTLSVWELYSQDSSNPGIMKILIGLDYGLLPEFNMPREDLESKLK